MNYEQRARLDALLGRKRRPAIFYNPEFSFDSMPRARWRCIERASRGLRVRTTEDVWKEHGTRSRDAGCGWYVNEFGETTQGAVLQIPGRDRMPRYVPACSDPWNADAYLADFRNVHDDIREAARDADWMAERYAEICREDEEQQEREMRAEDARAAIVEARREFAALVCELRNGPELGTTTCQAIRKHMQSLRDRVRESVATIREASNA